MLNIFAFLCSNPKSNNHTYFIKFSYYKTTSTEGSAFVCCCQSSNHHGFHKTCCLIIEYFNVKLKNTYVILSEKVDAKLGLTPFSSLLEYLKYDKVYFAQSFRLNGFFYRFSFRKFKTSCD